MTHGNTFTYLAGMLLAGLVVGYALAELLKAVS